MNGPPGAQLVSRGKQKNKSYNPNNNNNNKTNSADTKKTVSPYSQSHAPVEAISLCGLHSTLVNELQGNRGRGGGHHRGAFVSHFHNTPCPRGIVNNSNFCFMNSIMQAIIFIPSFAQLCISAVEEESRCPTLSSLGKWMLQYWKPGPTRLCMQPPRLPFTMAGKTVSANSVSRGVDGSIQEDAQEFLQRLLEVIHAELRQLELSFESREDGAATPAPSVASSERGWTVVRGKDKLSVREHADKEGRSLLLDSIFGGTLESHLKGKSKQRDHASVVVEHYFSLAIDVGFSMECTIEEAIERTMTTERIYDSERDKQLKKTLLLNEMPNILLLQLRRWAVTNEGELVKLDNTVRFGKTLVLPRSVCASEQLGNKARTYRLVSVVAHRGAAAGRGHYVTYLTQHAANPVVAHMKTPGSSGANSSAPGDGSSRPLQPHEAVLCNDSKVELCDFSQMEKESVYFLVYQKSK